jgi:hypothetical protein
MSPEFIEKWEKLLEDVDKQQIPMEFIKKITLKLKGRKQHSINVEKLIIQGLYPDEIEDSISEKLVEYDDFVVGIEFTLNVQSIAETVQPETDQLLRGL